MLFTEIYRFSKVLVTLAKTTCNTEVKTKTKFIIQTRKL